MEINRTNGINAYTANTTQDPQRSQVASQNQASARSDVTPQEARSAQQAFEVNLSQEARQLTADSVSQTEQPPGQQENQASQPPQETPQANGPSGPGQGEAARQQASQIVNIVA